MSQNDFAAQHSWADLLKEAITKPGIIHEAYSRFWNYSFGNQLLALMQCRARGIEPGPLASFNRWKELGRHVKKGEKAITLCMPIKIKCRELDQRREDAGMIKGDEVQSAGLRTAFVFKRNWFVLSQTEGEPYKPEPMPEWDRRTALDALSIHEEVFTLMDGNCQGYATKPVPLRCRPSQHFHRRHCSMRLLTSCWVTSELKKHPKCRTATTLLDPSKRLKRRQ